MSVIPALNDITPELLMPLPPGAEALPRKTPRPEMVPAASLKAFWNIRRCRRRVRWCRAFVGPTVSMMRSIAGFDADGAAGAVVESGSEAASAVDVAGVVGHEAGDIGERAGE